jgi:hypothetical protein
MRKLSLSLAAWFALFMGACSCGIEKKAVEDLKATHDLIFPEYLKMVESSNMSSDQKARRKAMVKSATDLVEALRRAVD